MSVKSVSVSNILLTAGLLICNVSYCGTINEAIDRHDITEVKRILSEDPTAISKPDDDGYWPLHLAAIANDVSICKLIVAAGTPVDQPTGSKEIMGGFTALHLAAQQGQKATVEYLLSVGANPNARSPVLKKTPLHLAIYDGHADIVAVLIAKGADLDAADNSDHTPLYVAAGTRRVDIVRTLLAANAKANVVDRFGATPLMAAIDWMEGQAQEKPYPTEQSLQIVRMLVAAGCNVNAADKESGMTALIYATSYRQTEIVKFLLENKADPNAMYRGQYTALDIIAPYTGQSDEDASPEFQKAKKAAGDIQRLLQQKGGKTNAAYPGY